MAAAPIGRNGICKVFAIGVKDFVHGRCTILGKLMAFISRRKSFAKIFNFEIYNYFVFASFFRKRISVMNLTILAAMSYLDEYYYLFSP